MIRAMNAETANKIPNIIVVLKIAFSAPRRVYFEPPSESAPKALPRPASERCKRIATIRRADKIICMYGSKIRKLSIGVQYSIFSKNEQLG